MTKNEKFIGIAKETRLPNKEPVVIESLTIIVIPAMAKAIETKPVIEIFSFRKNHIQVGNLLILQSMEQNIIYR